VRICGKGALALSILLSISGPRSIVAADVASAGFVRLYNGKDLADWQVQRGRLSSWKAEGEILSCVANGGGWLRTSKVYSDFVLRLDYRIPAGGNSGVGLRMPPKLDPAFFGMEIQILDDPDPQYKSIKPAQHTGSIYYQVVAKQGASKPAGQWNHYEITCRGPHVKIELNGQVVVDAMIDQCTKGEGGYKPLSERPEIGFIGLQSHGSQGAFHPVNFRNIELKDLTTAIELKNSHTGKTSTLRYVDITEGSGATVPSGATIEAHYSARLADGKKFDSSRERGAPATMPLGGLIRGLQEGIPGMKVGGRRKLIIPGELAFGAKGATGEIAPDATLVYDIEVTKLATDGKK